MNNLLLTNRISVPFLLLILTYVMFFYQLGAVGLIDPDEPRYAEAAREMIELGNWLIPHFNYQVRLNKPVFFYWLIISAYKILGINEFSSRVWSALFGTLGVGFTCYFGTRVFNPRVGLLSSLVLVTTFLYAVMARAATPDIVLSFFVTASLVSFFLAYMHKAGNKLCFLVFWLSLSLGVLTKGPVGFLLPALIIGSFLLLTGRFKEIFKAELLWGAMLFFTLTLPWYIYAYGSVLPVSQSFADFTFNETLGRFFLGYGHAEPVYYYIPVLLSALFPWSYFLPFSIKELFSSGWKHLVRTKQESLFILVWFIVVLLFFSLCRCKLASYLLPLTPACALLVGIFWDTYLAGINDASLLKHMKYALVAVAVVSIGTGITALLAVIVARQDLSFIGGILFVLFTTAGTVLLMTDCTSNRWAVFLAIPITIGIIFTLSMTHIFPEVEQKLSAKSVLADSKLIQDSCIIYSYRKLYPSSVFYSGRSVEVIRDREELLKLLNDADKKLCIISKEKFAELGGEFLSLSTVLAENAKLLLIGNRAKCGLAQSQVNRKSVQ